MVVVNPVTPQSNTPHRVPYLSWKITTWISKATLLIALFALIADVTVWVLTFASPHVVMPDWVFAPFFGLAIAFGAVGVLTWKWSHSRSSKRLQINLKRFNGLQRTVLIASFVLAVIALITSFVSLVAGTPGQPGYNATTHQYYFDNHGSITITTNARYLSGVAVQTRTFISFAFLFTFAAVLNLDGEYQARRRVDAPPVANVPLPVDRAPRWSIKPLPGVALAMLAVTVAALGLSVVISRVDNFLAKPTAVTQSGISQYFSAGPKVVFVFCETNAINAVYGCPSLTPSDIVIHAPDHGEVLIAKPDTSTDHISPRQLPAVGQLTFNAPVAGTYRLRLTRPIAKEVFVAESPGVIARQSAGSIVMAVIGIAGLGAVFVLLARRLRWRVSSASAVELPPNWT